MHSELRHVQRSWAKIDSPEYNDLSDSEKAIERNSLMNIESGDLSLPGTFSWYPSDSYTKFQTLSKKHKAAWKDVELTYKLNSYGMRMEGDPAPGNNILFLGCSMTFGIGVPKETSWPYLVSKQMNMGEINMGNPGGSLDSLFRLYNAWQYELQAPITCLLIPPQYRKEKIIESMDGDLLIAKIARWTINHMTSPEMQAVALQSINDTEMYMNEKRNIDAIKNIAHETNSKLIIIDSYNLSPEVYNKGSIGRDNGHPGFYWHEKVAETFLNEISNQRA